MISVLIVLVLVGVLLYVITLIPMDPTIVVIIRVVAILFVVIWLLSVFGVLDVPVPRLR